MQSWKLDIFTKQINTKRFAVESANIIWGNPKCPNFHVLNSIQIDWYNLHWVLVYEKCDIWTEPNCICILVSTASFYVCNYMHVHYVFQLKSKTHYRPLVQAARMLRDSRKDQLKSESLHHVLNVVSLPRVIPKSSVILMTVLDCKLLKSPTLIWDLLCKKDLFS